MASVPVSSGPSCRILTVGSTLERAVNLVEQIKALSPTSATTSKEETQTGDDGTDIVWKISNKYYSADVHFRARSVKGLAPFHLQEVPAVLFVWNKGNAYKHHIVRLAQDLKSHDPEVSLAIRLPTSNSNDQSKAEKEDEEEKTESQADTDAFLSDHGFEFIDVTSTDESIDEEEDDSHGIPSLPRVLDALSTIMWPSMQASTKTRSKNNAHTSAFLDWVQSSGDDTSMDFPSDVNLVTAADNSHSISGTQRQQKEMAELMRWLEEDADTQDDPWKMAAGIIQSPVDETDGLAEHFASTGATTSSSPADRFDDDFTVFVSAPPVTAGVNTSPVMGKAAEDDGDGWISANFTGGSFDTDNLAPSFSGITYHSLGSQPDLGVVEHGNPQDTLDNESDNDLPNEEEIQQSAKTIFGQSFTGPTSITSSHRRSDSDAHGSESDYETAPFDLSHVMSALEGMKAEIAGITDDNERRKAAARVALGLVYGLEAQQDGQKEP